MTPGWVEAIRYAKMDLSGWPRPTSPASRPSSWRFRPAPSGSTRISPVRLQALPGRDFEGKVTRTSWTLDARNRTLRTEIDVLNPKGTLQPGLYAYATVIVEEHTGALTVPTPALVRQDSQTYCVAVANGKAVRTPVTVGLEDGTRSEILSGLRGGEAIVKAYASSLSDGQSVSVIVPEAARAKPEQSGRLAQEAARAKPERSGWPAHINLAGTTITTGFAGMGLKP
jgi:hypothetical protein